MVNEGHDGFLFFRSSCFHLLIRMRKTAAVPANWAWLMNLLLLLKNLIGDPVLLEDLARGVPDEEAEEADCGKAAAASGEYCSRGEPRKGSG